jgi:lysophospholipase L1-like esterase
MKAERKPLLPIRTVKLAELLPNPLPPVLAPDELAGVHPFLMDDGGALDLFYEALWGLEKGGPPRRVRILHYGDSPTTADLITADTRELLQARFGDAGHGFVLMGKPWAWYEHRGVEVSSHGWKISTAVETTRESALGLGGAEFQGPAGAYSRFRLSDPGYSRIEVFYLAEPGAGAVQVRAGNEDLGPLETAAPAPSAGFRTYALPPHTQGVEVQALGAVRMFGVSFEKNGPGLIYDSLGLNGASTVVLSRVFGPENWTQELQHVRPDLVILNYGTNEAGFATYVQKQYDAELRRAIARLRAALPGAPILVMSPMDRGRRNAGAIETMPTIPEIVDIQRRVARETGCAFFNTFAAMGGESTMARWYEGQPRMVAADLIHPSPRGARLVAHAFYDQLVMGLYRYKMRRYGQVEAASLPRARDAGGAK